MLIAKFFKISNSIQTHFFLYFIALLRVHSFVVLKYLGCPMHFSDIVKLGVITKTESSVYSYK